MWETAGALGRGTVAVLRRRALRLLAMASLFGAVLVVAPSSASAVDTGGYPWADAVCYWGGAQDGPCYKAPKQTRTYYDWGYGTPNGANFDLFDPNGFVYRNCTSWVAWRLGQAGIPFNNSFRGQHWGDAGKWPQAARQAGLVVDKLPAAGAVAVVQDKGYGHVAYVESVSGSNVTLSEYNYGTWGRYGTRTVAASTVTAFIHFEDLGGSPPPPPPPPPSAPTLRVEYLPRRHGEQGLFWVTGCLDKPNLYAAIRFVTTEGRDWWVPMGDGSNWPDSAEIPVMLDSLQWPMGAHTFTVTCSYLDATWQWTNTSTTLGTFSIVATEGTQLAPNLKDQSVHPGDTILIDSPEGCGDTIYTDVYVQVHATMKDGTRWDASRGLPVGSTGHWTPFEVTLPLDLATTQTQGLYLAATCHTGYRQFNYYGLLLHIAEP